MWTPELPAEYLCLTGFWVFLLISPVSYTPAGPLANRHNRTRLHTHKCTSCLHSSPSTTIRSFPPDALAQNGGLLRQLWESRGHSLNRWLACEKWLVLALGRLLHSWTKCPQFTWIAYFGMRCFIVSCCYLYRHGTKGVVWIF